MGNQQFETFTRWDTDQFDMKNEYDQLLRDREFLRQYRIRTGIDSIPMPSNIYYLIKKYKLERKMERFPKGTTKYEPKIIKKCIRIVNTMCKNLRVTRIQEEDERNQDALMLFRSHIRFLLCSKRVLLKYRFTTGILSELCRRIENDVAMAVVCPGDMVGILSAQSIGEPSTQMTLNTVSSLCHLLSIV